jgi:hypothetical protein
MYGMFYLSHFGDVLGSLFMPSFCGPYWQKKINKSFVQQILVGSKRVKELYELK